MCAEKEICLPHSSHTAGWLIVCRREDEEEEEEQRWCKMQWAEEDDDKEEEENSSGCEISSSSWTMFISWNLRNLVTLVPYYVQFFPTAIFVFL